MQEEGLFLDKISEGNIDKSAKPPQIPLPVGGGTPKMEAKWGPRTVHPVVPETA